MKNNLIFKVKYLLECISPINRIQNSQKLNDKQKSKLLKNEKVKAWNMDTSILTIIDNFLSKLKKLEFKDIKNNELWIKAINGKYSFLLGKLNITPTEKSTGLVAYNTKDQYFRILSFFNLIFSDDYDKTKRSHRDTLIHFDYNFLNFFNKNNLDDWLSVETILDFISKGIIQKRNDYKRIVYSFLLSFVYVLDEKKEIINNVNHFILIEFVKRKNIKGIERELTYLEKLEKMTKETYGEIVKKTKNKITELTKKTDNYEIIEYFFDRIIKLILSSNTFFQDDEYGLFTNDDLDVKLREHIEYNNFINDISKHRSKLRNNILKLRNKNNDLHYSDIDPIDEKIIFIHDCVEQQEAAHIWSVKDIKKSKGENIFSDLENPNNGILIDYVYHDAYDRGWLKLDVNGHFIPTKEWKDRYYDYENNTYLKYPLMKIKESVFNAEMGDFISKSKN